MLFSKWSMTTCEAHLKILIDLRFFGIIFTCSCYFFWGGAATFYLPLSLTADSVKLKCITLIATKRKGGVREEKKRRKGRKNRKRRRMKRGKIRRKNKWKKRRKKEMGEQEGR